MLFNSPEFLLFFVIVVLVYFALPPRFRWVFLLIASYFFYMCWEASYALIILANTFVVWIAAILMEHKSQSIKRFLMVMCILICVTILLAFKYYNFFATNVQGIFDLLHIDKNIPLLRLLLPIGISFYTFQSLGYIFDVYKGAREPERHFGIFALYISFFPKLIAGPIDRSTHLLPQFHKAMTFDYDRVTDGLKLMAWGFFKKLVVADRLALYVDRVHASPHSYEGLPLILSSVFFAWQIYCDFSSYSDIAIGVSQVMGYELTDNFNRPFHARNIADFWRRWHISLINWLREYIYFPLGGNRVSKAKWYRNIMIVFTVSGFWHGAQWTYVVWGALNGVFIVMGIVTLRARDVIREKIFGTIALVPWPLYLLGGLGSIAAGVFGKRLGISIQLSIIAGLFGAFLIFFALSKRTSFYPKLVEYIKEIVQVFITWCLFWAGATFFRARSLADAWYITAHMFSNLTFQGTAIGFKTDEFAVMFLVIIVVEIFHFMQRHGSIRHMLNEKPVVVRWLVYHLFVFSILIGMYKTLQFIYFQF